MESSTRLTSEPKILKLWLKSFIPGSIEGGEVMKNGPHAGKTALTSPKPIEAWFLTDQRSFSDQPDAHSRMHSEIEIDLAAGAMTNQRHYCDATIQVDPESGDEVCNEHGDTGKMVFENWRPSETGAGWEVDLKASSHNPCFKAGFLRVAPNLDYEGVLNVQIDSARQRVEIRFTGKVEKYPAFEMYAEAEGQRLPVFRLPVEPNSTPADLAGGPGRDIEAYIALGW